jgi:hypothetical protein
MVGKRSSKSEAVELALASTCGCRRMHSLPNMGNRMLGMKRAVILEAMAFGTLLIIADSRGNAELVPSDFGLLVKGRKCRDQLISDLAEAPFLTSDDSALAYKRATTRRADIRRQTLGNPKRPSKSAPIEIRRTCR